MGYGRYYRRRRSWPCVLLVAALLVASACLVADERSALADPFAFAPATHEAGSLRHIGKVPVLTVRGTPQEMGDQLGTLLAAPLEYLASRQADLVAGFRLPLAPDLLAKAAELMAAEFPADALAEIKAAAKSSGVSYEFLLLGNVLYDFSKIGGCSALMVDREHSATGETLMGRNMDFPRSGSSTAPACW